MIFTFFLIIAWIIFLLFILPADEIEESTQSESFENFDWKAVKALACSIEEEWNKKVQDEWLERLNAVIVKPTKQDLRDIFGRFGQ